ncbi:MAG: outer membrane beta-barrel protein [Gammaproteobacteria bacterium]|nr:outer membrane beta-barrel protein [Gammaproteobacteria bacterium]MCH9744016.1 outer membrane beta-barrel protein [Gammaproteobacteria bacterium]
MKKLTVSIIAATALVATGVSFAGGPDHYRHSNNVASVAPTQRSGVYVNGGIGYGNITSKADSTVDSKKGFVWNGALGYQFNPYIAVEAGYLALPTVKFNDNSTEHSGVWNLLAKGMYPVMSNLDVFAKAGVGVTRDSYTADGTTTSDTNHRIVPIVGGGADYYVTNNVAITGQVLYTFQNGSNGAVNFPSSLNGLVGVTYKF